MNTSFESTPTAADPIEVLDSIVNELADVDDWDERTTQTGIPSIHVHAHMDSKPDSDPPGKSPKTLAGALRWALVALGTGAALAAAQAAQSCHR